MKHVATTHQILREYVREVLSEASPEDAFKFAIFEKIDDLDNAYDYAAAYLDELGSGSSRTTFVYTSQKVIKVALDEKGIAQNEAEVDVYTSPTTRPVVTRIYDFDPDFKWIVAERVEPLALEESSTGQGPWDQVFLKKYGVEFSSFRFGLWDVIERGDNIDEYIDYVRENYEPHPGLEDYFKFFRAIVATVESGSLMIGDVKTPVHWGTTHDGRIVILDYGYTKEVARKHYVRKPHNK